MSWKYFVCLYMCALHLSKNTTKGGGKKEGGKQERKREQEKDHSEETRVEGREKSTEPRSCSGTYAAAPNEDVGPSREAQAGRCGPSVGHNRAGQAGGCGAAGQVGR